MKFFIDDYMAEEHTKNLVKIRQESRKARAYKPLGFTPRVLRLKHAHIYLGMDKNRFNAEVRPHLTEIPIGKQGVGFDRLDLDAWVDAYKESHGRPGQQKGGKRLWGARKSLVSSNAGKSGISKSDSTARELEKLLERITSRKRNVT
jgi:hypothetical protein